MNITRAATVALACFTLTAASGCAATAESDKTHEGSVAQYQDGLTIVEADATIGKLVAVFARDGRAVTFHLRQGEKIPVDLPADPSSRPSYQIDARISDQEGRPMGTQMGADEFIDPTWKMEGSKGIDPVVRANDFETAFAATEAFIAWKAPAGLEQLRLGAIDVARRSNPALNVMPGVTPGTSTAPTGSGPALGTKTEHPTDNNYVNPAGEAYANYDWNYSIYWDDVTGPIGEHSSTRLRLYRDGGTTLLQWWDACNHGRCAEGDGMQKACTSVRLNDTNDTRYYYGESIRNTGDGTGGCTNHYAMIPIDNDHHNCHNDTRLQRYAISTGSVGAESRAGNYGSLCSQSDIHAPKTCPTTF